MICSDLTRRDGIEKGAVMEGTFEEARGKALWNIGYYFGEVIRHTENNPTLDGIFERADRLFFAIADAKLFGLISEDEADEYEGARSTIIDEACDVLREKIMNRRNDEAVRHTL